MENTKRAAVISSYSPNIEWGKQHVEIVLRQWEYTASFTMDVGGNCSGFDVIECAIGNLFSKLAEASPDGEQTQVLLTDPAGETLECHDDDELEEEWLKKMVVSAAIVGWTAPTINEVRRLNGADPVTDGDRPWQPL